MLRNGLIGAAVAGAVVYAGAIVYLVGIEQESVYPGAAIPAEVGLDALEAMTIPWDTLRVTAEDGTPVFLLESRQPDSTASPWVLYFHGNGNTVMGAGNQSRYALFREVGYNVLAVEYRGYGMSRGVADLSESGLYADARAGWRYLTEEVGVDGSRIVVYGWSLGSGVATHIASRNAPAGLITEGAFTSLPEVGQYFYPWLPVTLVMRNRYDNVSRAGALTLPWLVLHATGDQLIPFEHARELAESAPEARLVELPGGHGDAMVVDRSLTKRVLDTFTARLFDAHPVQPTTPPEGTL